MRPYVLPAVLLLIAAAPSAPAVTDAWSRPAAAGATGVAYLTINDAAEDSLVGASSPVAAQVVLHRSAVVNGVSEMRPVDAVPVGPDAPLTLAPGGYHLMLLHLTRALATGDRFPLTLRFAQAGEVTTEVAVREGAHGGMQGMGHK